MTPCTDRWFIWAQVGAKHSPCVLRVRFYGFSGKSYFPEFSVTLQRQLPIFPSWFIFWFERYWSHYCTKNCVSVSSRRVQIASSGCGMKWTRFAWFRSKLLIAIVGCDFSYFGSNVKMLRTIFPEFSVTLQRQLPILAVRFLVWFERFGSHYWTKNCVSVSSRRVQIASSGCGMKRTRNQ